MNKREKIFMIIKIFLNTLHLLYCVLFFVSFDTPFLCGWDLKYCALYYGIGIIPVIWGIFRFIGTSKEDFDENFTN